MSLFNTFSMMINEMPAKVVPKALELERQMLEDDIAHARTLQADEAHSILTFCRFVYAVKRNKQIPPTTLPAEHIGFYRKTINRLIESRLLSADTLKQFDAAFPKGFFGSIKNAA
jgi:hypothetical protein